MKTILTLALLIGSLAIGVAQCVTPLDGSLDHTSYHRGDTITFTAYTSPGATVFVNVEYPPALERQYATAVADANGVAVFTFVIPGHGGPPITASLYTYATSSTCDVSATNVFRFDVRG